METRNFSLGQNHEVAGLFDNIVKVLRPKDEEGEATPTATFEILLESETLFYIGSFVVGAVILNKILSV